MIELQPDLELTVEHAERLLATWLGSPVSCSGVHALKGGLVNSVFRLDFDRPPHRAVVKIRRPEARAFSDEAAALEFLRSETDCPVPRVHLYDDRADVIDVAYLLLEHVDGECLANVELAADERIDLDRQLADVLAELHGHVGDHYGRIAEPDLSGRWGDVVAARLREARRYPMLSERLPSSVLADVDAAIENVPAILADAGTPTLIHADVWEGNTIVRRDGDRWRIAALVDPDLQYADPEMELAYLEVFDHDRSELFETYAAQRPLRDGYERRRRCYWLYTALVHVGLFGDEFFRDYTARIAAEVAAG